MTALTHHALGPNRGAARAAGALVAASARSRARAAGALVAASARSLG